MKGGETAKWIDEDMADHFLQKAQQYVKSNKNEHFFLYYALQQPHVPRTPHPRFVGSSGMGPRGDVIIEADWCVGEFIKTLEQEGLLENTLIVFSSDNGPVVDDGYHDDSVEKLGAHIPTGPLRGGKYSLFEAGTRVPFITYWKGTIQPGVSDALVSHLDLLSSMATLAGSNQNGHDSQNLLDTFLGKSKTGRKELILEATSRTSFRKGDWVMIPPYKGRRVNKSVNIELGNDTIYQLYNLKDDLGQQNNMAETYPEKLAKMITAYEAILGEKPKKIEVPELK
jgi:arylsulfatase A-like enzyme